MPQFIPDTLPVTTVLMYCGLKMACTELLWDLVMYNSGVQRSQDLHNHVDVTQIDLLAQLGNYALQFRDSVFVVKSLLFLSFLQLSLHSQLLNLTYKAAFTAIMPPTWSDYS